MAFYFLALSLLLVLVLPAFGQPHPGNTSDLDLGGEGRLHNPIYIIVAKDEESPSWNEVTSQTVRGLYRFPFHTQIIANLTWLSPNSMTTEQLIVELKRQMAWTHGKTVNGKTATALIGWTGQHDGLGGAAYVGQGVALVVNQADWTDDNTVQHEFTHLLYGGAWHCDLTDVECVMNKAFHYWYFVDEYWTPYPGMKTIAIWNWQRYDAISQTWCSLHWQAVMNSHGVIYGESTAPGTRSSGTESTGIDGESYILTDPDLNHTEEINPPIYETLLPYIIVGLIGVGVGIAVGYLLKKKIWTREKKK